MNRRTFTQSLATAALAAAAPRLPAAASAADAPPAIGPFPLSIMLWTVFNDLPFEERLKKVVEAGYTNVELVGEYKNWTADDFARANAARRRLGVHFDATAGLPYGLADAAHRDEVMAAFGEALKPMETLEIPAMIMLSGNVAPGVSREAQHQSCVDGLKRAAAMVEGRQIAGKPVTVLLECIDPEENAKIYLSSAAEAM
jgi:hydroxypyruvate isomerase